MLGNHLYDAARSSFLQGQIPYLTGDIKVSLISTAIYTPNLATDQYLSIIPGGGVVATSTNFASKTATAGVANAAGITFPLVAGPPCAGLVIFYDTGVAGTSRLIAWIDTGPGLPATPNGSDITIKWAALAPHIFAL